ncbi:MAG: nucleotidyltransferase domain-containing protein [Ilumatobacteraceae bacterium]
MVDERLRVASFGEPFGVAARPIADVIALYVRGSVASGDYRPGMSDLDLVAIVESPLDEERRGRLAELHRATIRDDHRASALHCVYVPVGEIADIAREHPTWAFGELFDRMLSGIARAELLGDPVVLYGPAARESFPGMDRADITAAAAPS